MQLTFYQVSKPTRKGKKKAPEGSAWSGTGQLLHSQSCGLGSTLPRPQRNVGVLLLKTGQDLVDRPTQWVPSRAPNKIFRSDICHSHSCTCAQRQCQHEECYHVFQPSAAWEARTHIPEVSQLARWKHEYCWQTENGYSPDFSVAEKSTNSSFLNSWHFQLKNILFQVFFFSTCLTSSFFTIKWFQWKQTKQQRTPLERQRRWNEWVVWVLARP